MRASGKISVKFTPRVFPTAMRESTKHLEDEVCAIKSNHVGHKKVLAKLLQLVCTALARTLKRFGSS